jgi:hypothetical protein
MSAFPLANVRPTKVGASWSRHSPLQQRLLTRVQSARSASSNRSCWLQYSWEVRRLGFKSHSSTILPPCLPGKCYLHSRCVAVAMVSCGCTVEYRLTSLSSRLSNPAFLQGDHWPELRLIFFNTGYAVLYALSLTTSQWLGSICALYWQRSLVDQFHRVYFKSKVLYAASKMVPELDNVDQRIADDSRNFTQGLSTCMFGGNNLGVTEGQGILQVSL